MITLHPYTGAEPCPHDTKPPETPTRWKRWQSRLLPVVLAIPALLAFATSTVSAETPPLLYGVNLAGGDAYGTGIIPGEYGKDYRYPSAEDFDYYQSKGLTLIRLPVKWKRLQDNLNGPLNETRMQQIDTVIGYARDRGMKIIIDLHDYNRYKISGVDYGVGTTQVPHSALAHLWSLVADRYKNEPAIYGYDLMNEPISTITNWKAAAQAAITAIRNTGDQHWILVEGIGASGAYTWVTNGNHALLDLTDPADKLIYSAHCYFDFNSSGTYTNTYAAENRYPEVGVNKVKPFVEWCVANNVHGLIGEYGIPYNMGYNAEWNVVLRNFMNYLKANNISGTYWVGGTWQEFNVNSCQPTSNYTVEKPVMSVLQDFPNSPDIIVDNSQTSAVTITGSWVTSSASPGYEGSNYLHDNNAGKGSKSVTFTPTIPTTGNYQVFMRWTSASNRAPEAPVRIHHANGTASLTVDQQSDGGTWVPIGTHTFNAGTGGSIVISNEDTTGYFVIADAVKLVPDYSLPGGWTAEDIGTVGPAGSALYHGSNTYTVKGSGTNIGGTADSFQFAHLPVTGDCTITARVVTQTNTNAYARAGVMIREGNAANAKQASAIITPTTGLYLLSRTTTGASGTATSGGAGAVPYWVRLIRAGNVFTAYKSTDGTTWTLISSKTITMTSAVEVGLAVCSFTNTALGTATFDNVSVTTP